MEQEGTSSSGNARGSVNGKGMEWPQKEEIYTYQAPFHIYGANWSYRPDKRFRLAIGSFQEDQSNAVEIIQLDESRGELVKTASFEHPYPPTKIMWIPDKTGTREDLLATTGDFLRLWKVDNDGNVIKRCTLNNVRRNLRLVPSLIS